jgi:hypothetical protein
LISRTLSRPLHAKVVSDDKAIERSQLDGRDLWQTGNGSALVRSIEDWVQKIAAQGQPPDDNVRRSGVLSRLFGRIVGGGREPS